MRTLHRYIRPIQVLPLGFLAVILIGTLLLTLPACSADGKPLPFMDALFTATSATCVTGLVVVDTGTQYTVLGQVIILVLLQTGGLGFMTLATLLFMALKRRISLHERMTIAEAFGADRLQGMVRLVLSVIKVTLIIELSGAILLALRFVPVYGAAKGTWFAVFHSISAFCNAGFDLIGGYRSLTPFAADPLVNIVVMLLVVLGGLGFAVVTDVVKNRRFSALKLHSKVAITATAVMLLSGFVCIALLEWDNPNTLGAMPPAERVMASMFQSVTARTAGFNTFNQLTMRDSSKLVTTLLMIVGAAPAGTGGGMKVTTASLVMLSVWSVIKNREDIDVFGHRISPATVRRAQAILMLYVCMMALFAVLIDAIEVHTHGSSMGIINELFEVASAFGTVGLSTGVTGATSQWSRMLIIIGMYLGRVGPLTMVLSLAGRSSGKNGIRYPEGNIMVG